MRQETSDTGTQNGNGSAAKTFTLGILEAGDNRPELIDEHGGYSDWFEDLIGSDPDQPFAFRRYTTHAGVLPASPQECDGYLITGSRYSVTEQAPWMLAAKDFIRRASADRPFIGVCFGHQLLADTFGGRVEPADYGWIVGVHEFDVIGQKPWMTPASPKIALVGSNCDQVTQPPPGAEVLAGSADCPIGMMQIGANVITVQTHPEAPKPLMEIIYNIRRDLIGSSRTDDAIRTLAHPTDSTIVAQWFRRFLAR